ncbi:hypothetical protein K458DRAFT_121534 [Lentithecium fluviatile CBS 122367]|uniref:Transcription factor domain-containing protein n=1 Tax=Lentithecium fluviatile CBS 122367 TaxID=1168545 RepID=A0A6G1IL43_9PLEO|nr:hypothetical protein K458DRAFT_121534 [Lentithecium fluviatile CBS 122367]
MFHFVTINHPSEAKDHQRQTGLRQHAIRTGLRKQQADSAKRNNNFVVMKMDAQTRKPKKKPRGKEIVKIPKPIDADLLDPFDALYGSGKRLRMLMLQKSLKPFGELESRPTDAERVYSHGMNAIFLGSLTEPTMFHAMSLVLSLATSSKVPTLTALEHRGAMVKDVRKRMADAKLVPSISTLCAMLLLIGYEYRVDGSNASNIEVHIRAIQNVLNLTRTANAAISNALRRALYWHDMYSCLFIGTPRFLSHEGYVEFGSDQKLSDFPGHYVPTGFRAVVSAAPSGYGDILRDLDVLCYIIDSCSSPGTLSLHDFPFEDFQYRTQSSLVDLLVDTKVAGIGDPIYQACIFAAFLCTYMLSPGIWEGCFIPDFCAVRVLSLTSQAKKDSRWAQWKELLLWLLVVSGALTRKNSVRARALMMIRVTFRDALDGMYGDCEQLEATLRTFIWSDYAMQRHVWCFWEELRECR